MISSLLTACRRLRLLSIAVIATTATALVLVPVDVTPAGISIQQAVCQTGGCHQDENYACLWGDEGIAEGYRCTGGACESCVAGAGFCFSGTKILNNYLYDG